MPLPLRALSCAKVNLSLDIVGVRGDGYHELRSVAHTIALCDTLLFEFDGSGQWQLSCDDEELATPDNLCLKAARAWTQSARDNGFREPIGGTISLQKRIPHGAGLGGGSGNAWAVLEALGQAYDPGGETVPRPQLLLLAKTLGADVPLFAHGGAMLIEGIGERITKLQPLEGWVVLAQPSARISTPEAFRAWDEQPFPSGEASDSLLEAWSDENFSDDRLQWIADRLGNDLWDAAHALGVPIKVGIETLRLAGALGAEMTGSGSAVFGLCRDEAHAQSVEQRARRILTQSPDYRADGWRLWRAPLCGYGARFEDGSGCAST